ncbi:MAG TPA: hypothetical protein VMA98_06060 [Candidatus Acidoferrales bacterium]|nr:hypothetical protein [Candidatus Acidoferrales bacterium]
MDCYFHSNVPSVAPCAHCGKAICATCRDEQGGCPSCRLGQKIDATVGERRQLHGQVPPRPSAPPQAARGATVTTVSDDPVESRALAALGYPLWPLALLALLDSKKSNYIKRQALQALGFNVGFAAFWGLLELVTQLPFLGWSPLGWSSNFVLLFMLPLFLVSSAFFGIKAWHGDPVRVPVISDWLDERMPA